MRTVSAHSGAITRRALIAAAFVVVGAAAYAQSHPGLRVYPLPRDGQLLVSFELPDGFTEEIRAAIKSGLKTTYTYSVDLRTEVAVWLDRTMASSVVAMSVEYDNLTRVYTVVQLVDGRTEWAKTTSDEAEVRRMMTSVTRMPLFKTNILEKNREYYLRVAASARPTNGSMLWPFGSGTSATAKFTILR